MGAGSWQVASDWFDAMHEDVSAIGARFTAVGIVTPDPASVESFLASTCDRERRKRPVPLSQQMPTPEAPAEQVVPLRTRARFELGCRPKEQHRPRR
jgi:hypothetical protein